VSVYFDGYIGNMEILLLIWLKILEVFQSFWFKALITAIWWSVVYFFKLQDAAHTAVTILFLLDWIVGIAHSVAKKEFSHRELYIKFRIKFFAYAILIFTGFALDLAIIKWHTEFWFHYMACVFLALTEWASISRHLEAFKIRVPFKNKINTMLESMYTK